MSTPQDWARAFARQALADWSAWSLLQQEESVPDCHRLMFLQMACEKLAKGYLCAAGAEPNALQSSHGYIAKNIPIILRQQLALLGQDDARGAWVVRHSRHIAREVEMLAPVIRRGGQRPDNCEFPWEDDAGTLHSPLDWSFAPSRLLIAPAGRTFLKIIHDAIRALLR